MSGFNLLPEEIIIYIFDKIKDAKFLFICTLVSKRISSLVLQAQPKIVYVEIPSWISVCGCHQNPNAANAKPLFQSLLHFIGKPVTSLCWLLKQPFTTTHADKIPKYIPIFKFLQKFSCIESLTLKMGFSKQTSFYPLVKWKYDKSGFIFICAKDVCLNSSDKDVLAPPNLFSVTYHWMDALLRFKILKPTFRNFPKLKKVLVLDSLNQGRVVMDEDDINGMRDEEEPLTDYHDVKFCIKMWHKNVLQLCQNVLHLRGSGLVMKRVTVIMIKKIGTDDDLFDDV